MHNEEVVRPELMTAKLVNAQTLLETLFDHRSRPSVRSLRKWTKDRIVPSIRCGGLVFYDVEQVKAALAKQTAH